MTITGDGPPLVLVEPAGHHRGFSAYDGLVAHLHPRFTVVTYDRRGRGDSSDTPPYTVEREVEDLAAVIEATAGDGVADVHGASSGALLAIQAAVHGAPIRRLSLFEPPLDDDVDAQAAFTSQLRTRLEESNDAGLEYFLGSIMPSEFLEGMRGSPQWTAMAEVAPTLVHDCAISQATGTDTLAAVHVPTIVLGSQASSEDLLTMTHTVARHVPDARHQLLPGGWHGADDEAIAAALMPFLLDDDLASTDVEVTA
jgi:pimeloyl-ACP methyl ester carboxylesterase